MGVFPQNVSEQEGRCKKDNLVAQKNPFFACDSDITELVIISQAVESPGSVQPMLLPTQMKLLCHHTQSFQALKIQVLRKQHNIRFGLLQKLQYFFPPLEICVSIGSTFFPSFDPPYNEDKDGLDLTISRFDHSPDIFPVLFGLHLFKCAIEPVLVP